MAIRSGAKEDPGPPARGCAHDHTVSERGRVAAELLEEYRASK
ncbi:hypothetical protein [Clavibacter michiganensis]|nr:hypothetical protein [Clavibacter michiganensis]AWF99951.1 hypothetical protein BEH61_15705 [Clavibacter michiganensis subsp. insidiosus]